MTEHGLDGGELADKVPSSDSSYVSLLEDGGVGRGLAPWVKVGTVAAISALAGGIAAAWFYRKTLQKLQNLEHEGQSTNFRMDLGDHDEL